MTASIWSGVVPVDAIDIIEARVERLRRRALSKGFPVPSIVHGSRSFRSNEDGTSTQWLNLSIEADGALRIGDYEFVGTISTLGDGSPFVTYAPGVERVDDDFATVNYCDHCRTSRDRNDTYIVRSTSGVTKQVGSSCIKDFTGHDPSAIVGWLKAVADLSFSDDEISGWGRSASRFYPVADIIARSACIVAREGYVSKAKSDEEGRAATAELVRGWLSASGAVQREFEVAYPATDASENLFADTMAAISVGGGTSEWAQDISRLVAAGSVQWRHVGIVGSAVILGMRKSEREATEGRPASHFIGDIGQRLEFSDVTVTLVRGYENMYGHGNVVRMSVNESDDLLWFASGDAGDSLTEGSKITLVGTVKAHEMDSRSHRETTVLTRCKVRE